MNQSIASKKTLGLIVLILTVVASATTAFAQEVEQRSQISIQGTALVTKNSKDQIPSNEATKSGGCWWATRISSAAGSALKRTMDTHGIRKTSSHSAACHLSRRIFMK